MPSDGPPEAPSLKEYTPNVPHKLYTSLENAREVYQQAIGAHLSQSAYGQIASELR